MSYLFCLRMNTAPGFVAAVAAVVLIGAGIVGSWELSERMGWPSWVGNAGAYAVYGVVAAVAVAYGPPVCP